MSLEKAIKKTVEYGRKYRHELSSDEIYERLISDKTYSEEEINKYVVFSIKDKTLRPAGTSLDREALIIKIKKAKRLIKLIKSNFKDILMVGVTGSVAAGNPKKDDDIDLMIITKRNKLWWTRLKLRYFIYKNKIPHRMYRQKERRDEFCFNLWRDEDRLKISKSRQNLKNAMDLILMKPILNRGNIYTKFIQENSWVKKWVATGYSKLDRRSSIVDRRKTNKLFWWIVNFFDVCTAVFVYEKEDEKWRRGGVEKGVF